MVFSISDIRGKEAGGVIVSFDFHPAASPQPLQKTRSSSNRIKYCP
jgi:hypothetical protein